MANAKSRIGDSFSSAFVIPPVAVPSLGISIAHHGAGNIARLGRTTERRSAIAPGAACRSATHCRARHLYVPGAQRAGRRAYQSDEVIAGRTGVDIWTRMTRLARPVHFASGDTRKANMRAFFAPDRTVTVPYCSGRAIERLARRDDGYSKHEREDHPHALARRLSFAPDKKPRRDKPRRGGVALWVAESPSNLEAINEDGVNRAIKPQTPVTSNLDTAAGRFLTSGFRVWIQDSRRSAAARAGDVKRRIANVRYF